MCCAHGFLQHWTRTNSGQLAVKDAGVRALVRSFRVRDAHGVDRRRWLQRRVPRRPGRENVVAGARLTRRRKNVVVVVWTTPVVASVVLAATGRHPQRRLLIDMTVVIVMAQLFRVAAAVVAGGAADRRTSQLVDGVSAGRGRRRTGSDVTASGSRCAGTGGDDDVRRRSTRVTFVDGRSGGRRAAPVWNRAPAAGRCRCLVAVFAERRVDLAVGLGVGDGEARARRRRRRQNDPVP